jgi:Zn-dependent protease with chaperone function
VSVATTLRQLRFDYEDYLFKDLLRYTEINTWQHRTDRQQRFDLHQRYLLGNAVKVTPSLFPQLTAIYQDCLAHVNAPLTGQLYVHQGSEYNANVYAHEQQFDILLTSALVRDFKPAEIAFVIGHELGHVLFEHNHIPRNLLFTENAPTLPVTLAKRLFQWSYAAEISADRIGFLMCGSLSSAANAFFKTASGIQLDDDNRVVHALRDQFAEIERLTAQLDNPGLSTHPLIPIRFKSLELISLDLLNFRNRQTLKVRDLKAIDQKVQAVLAQTTPVHLEVRRDAAVLAEETFISLLLLCLLYVATCDGAIQERELQFLRHIVEQATTTFHLDDVLQEAQKDNAAFQAQLLKDLSTFSISRAQMLDVLGQCIRLCEKPPTPLEVMAMKTLCMTLKQKSVLVDNLLTLV